MALALAGFGRRRTLASVLGALGGGALVLALGKYLPVHALFRLVVFPFAYMRFPESTPSCWSAGWPCWPHWGGTRAQSGATAMAAGGCFAWPIACARCHRAVFLPRALGCAGHPRALAGGLAAAGVLTVQFLALRRSRLAPILLIAIVGLDLAAATWPLQSFAARGLAAVSASATRVVLADSSGRGEPPRLYRANNVCNT